jgi:hypothetical protein
MEAPAAAGEPHPGDTRYGTEVLEVVSVIDPSPNRGQSSLVRVYLDVRL